MKPMISVILPNYNHAQFLKQRIDSILNQTFQDFELIIMDDCSSDDSIQIIESYRDHPKINRIILNDINSGSAFKQWYKGVVLAIGKYIWIAESDDWAEPDFLETMQRVLEKNPRVGLAYCNTSIYVENQLSSDFGTIKSNKLLLNIWQSDYIVEGTEEIKRALLYDCTINNASSVLFRRDKLLSILPSLRQFRFSGDWFSYLQIANKSDIAYVAKAFNNYRDHADNISKTAKHEYIQEAFYIYSWLRLNSVVSNKDLLQAFHAYISNIYASGIKWDCKWDFFVLRKIDLYLYCHMTWKLMKRKIRRLLIFKKD